DVPDPGVPGPLVLGPLADDDLTDRRRGVEGVGLGEHADPGVPGEGHPPVVDGLIAGEDPDESGLAAAVAADDPDALPLSEAEGDVVEHLGGAEREAGALDGDEVGHQSRRAVGRMCAPWTGPVARRMSPATPDAVSETATSIAPS